MSYFRKFLRYVREFHKGNPLSYAITFIFILMFMTSLLVEALRSSAAFIFIWGAITVNLPTIVVIFYLLVCVILGIADLSHTMFKNRTQIKLTGKNKNFNDIGSDSKGTIDDIEIEEIE